MLRQVLKAFAEALTSAEASVARGSDNEQRSQAGTKSRSGYRERPPLPGGR